MKLFYVNDHNLNNKDSFNHTKYNLSFGNLRIVFDGSITDCLRIPFLNSTENPLFP